MIVGLCEIQPDVLKHSKVCVPILYISFLYYAANSSDSSASAAPVLQALPKLGEVITATAETAIILAACHSLVVVEDADAIPASASYSAAAGVAENGNVSAAEKAARAASAANANLVGDPIELAAIKGTLTFLRVV